MATNKANGVTGKPSSKPKIHFPGLEEDPEGYESPFPAFDNSKYLDLSEGNIFTSSRDVGSRSRGVDLDAPDLGTRVLNTWILNIAGTERKSVRRLSKEVDEKLKAHGYAKADTIERMLIEQLLVNWLQTLFAEMKLGNVHTQDERLVGFWREHMTRFQKGLLNVVKTLTDYRRVAKRVGES